MKKCALFLSVVAVAVFALAGNAAAMSRRAPEKRTPPKSQFERADANHDGVISKEEFDRYEKSLAAARRPAPPAGQERLARSAEPQRPAVQREQARPFEGRQAGPAAVAERGRTRTEARGRETAGGPGPGEFQPGSGQEWRGPMAGAPERKEARGAARHEARRGEAFAQSKRARQAWPMAEEQGGRMQAWSGRGGMMRPEAGWRGWETPRMRGREARSWERPRMQGRWGQGQWQRGPAMQRNRMMRPGAGMGAGRAYRGMGWGAQENPRMYRGMGRGARQMGPMMQQGAGRGQGMGQRWMGGAERPMERGEWAKQGKAAKAGPEMKGKPAEKAEPEAGTKPPERPRGGQGQGRGFRGQGRGWENPPAQTPKDDENED